VAGKNSVAFALQVAAPAANCANGGITVQSGIDTNGNGALDAAEVTNTQYVCNGANGSNGANGTYGSNGVNGLNGLTGLVLVTAVPVGANCAAGGQQVSAGADANGNNILDASEVTSISSICNGGAGATGASGATGPAGANGLTTSVAMVPDSQLLGCTYGGSMRSVLVPLNVSESAAP
jgi:hypothetical protein